MEALEIPETQLKEAQKTLTHTFLPYLGYNRHTPIPVVYAQREQGGIGLIDLPTAEGVAHVQYIIGSMRCSSDTRKPIIALIESYQIIAGMTDNPLMNTEPREYINSPWLDITRAFLRRIKATIDTPTVKIIAKQYTNDKEIMELAIRYTHNKQKQTAINNCRIYLQIFTIADITTENGARITTNAYNGQKTPNQHTTMSWPTQRRPPESAWRTWRKLIRTLVKKNSLWLKRTLYGRRENVDMKQDQDQNKYTTGNCKRKIKKSNKILTKRAVKIIDSPLLEIILVNNNSEEEYRTSGEIYDDHQKISYQEIVTPKKKEDSNQHTETSVIRMVLETIIEACQMRNTLHSSNHLTIWVESTKTKKIIMEAKNNEPTISTSTKNNGENINRINEIMNMYKNSKVEIIKKTSSERVKKSLETQKKGMQKWSHNAKIMENMADMNINGTKIQNNLRKEMTRASTDTLYLPYLARKIDVTIDTLNQIDWRALEMAIKKSPFKSLKTIPQLLHRWLPTRGHPSMAEHFEGQEYCPRCKQHKETNDHFIWCQTLRNEWTTNYENESSKVNSTPIQAELTKILTAILNNRQPILPPKYKNIADDQKKIGWKQMIYGRFSKLWADEYEEETETADGTKWVSKNIIMVWKHIRTRWESRCEMVHDESTEGQKELSEVMDKRIDKRYDEINDLPYTERLIYDKDINTIKDLPTNSKREWLQRTKRITKYGKLRMRTSTSTRNTRTRQTFFSSGRVTANSTHNSTGNSNETFHSVSTSASTARGKHQRKNSDSSSSSKSSTSSYSSSEDTCSTNESSIGTAENRNTSTSANTQIGNRGLSTSTSSNHRTSRESSRQQTDTNSSSSTETEKTRKNVVQNQEKDMRCNPNVQQQDKSHPPQNRKMTKLPNVTVRSEYDPP
jgi:hypothetical protein